MNATQGSKDFSRFIREVGLTPKTVQVLKRTSLDDTNVLARMERNRLQTLNIVMGDVEKISLYAKDYKTKAGSSGDVNTTTTKLPPRCSKCHLFKVPGDIRGPHKCRPYDLKPHSFFECPTGYERGHSEEAKAFKVQKKEKTGTKRTRPSNLKVAQPTKASTKRSKT